MFGLFRPHPPMRKSFDLTMAAVSTHSRDALIDEFVRNAELAKKLGHQVPARVGEHLLELTEEFERSFEDISVFKAEPASTQRAFFDTLASAADRAEAEELPKAIATRMFAVWLHADAEGWGDDGPFERDMMSFIKASYGAV